MIKSFSVKSNDYMYLIYVCSLIKSVISLHSLINNKIQNKELQEENRKKEAEMLKQQEQMKRTIDELKRKAEQGSQQIQGDIQEEDMKQALSQAFPIDNIEDVPTGVK